ncbi:MAG: glycosyltransferase family 4 protein, partial [Hyphomicrobiaceae bacterium]
LELVKVRGRDDIQCAIVGSGTELESLKKLASELGVSDHVTFTGFMTGEPLLRAFSSFDIGVIPDPKNIYNDSISMNKVFEYMTLAIPFVQFDLVEGRNAAGDAAVYAKNNDPLDLADRIADLLDASARRVALARAGRARAAALLRWDLERAMLLAAYRRALGVSTDAATGEREVVKTAG